MPRPFIPVINVAEVVVNGLIDGQQINNVFNFLYPSALTIPDLTGLGIDVIQSWTDNLQTQVSTDYELISVKCTDLTTVSSPSVINFPVTALNGSWASPSVPLNTALVVSWHTELRGRSFRGRTYHAGIGQDGKANAGSVTDPVRANILAGYANFISDIESSSANDHVIVSRRNAGAWRTTGVATIVTGVSVNNDFDSMRSRLVGRGS